MPQGKHSIVQLDLGANINLALKPQRIAHACYCTVLHLFAE